MRLTFSLVCVLALASLALAACAGEEEGPTETSLPTGSPSPARTVSPAASTPTAAAPTTRIGSYDDPYDFRSFGQQLASAIEDADVQFLLTNTTFEDLSCAAEFPAPPDSCQGQPANASVPGIVVGVWQSEGFGLDAAGYEEFIGDLLTNFAAGTSYDAYGGPKPRLYAWSVPRPEFRVADPGLETVYAIATNAPGPFPGRTDPPRSVVVFRANFVDQAWTIAGLLVGPLEMLDPTLPTADVAGVEGFFEYWERWEGSP